jgi:hypothetical protein
LIILLRIPIFGRYKRTNWIYSENMEDYTLEKLREAIANRRKKGKKMIKNISELG